MHPDTFGARLLRQIGMALGVLVLVMLLMEAALPGSVTPYIDPLPLGILGLALLALQASVPSPAGSKILRMLLLLFGAVLMTLTFFVLAGPWHGLSGVFAFSVAAVILLSIAFFCCDFEKEP